MDSLLLARLAAALLAAGMVALGLGSWRSERRLGADSEAFWTAHRSLSGWSLGMSLSASMLSVSWSLVYGVELLYRWGAGGLWLLAVPWLAVLALFAVLARRLRAFPAFSQGELFAALYGRAMRWVTVAVLVAVFSAWCGAEINAAGELIAPLVGSSPKLAMAGIALLVASYTWTGGFRSVVVTDVAQFGIVAVFLVVVGARACVPAPPPASAWLAVPGPSAGVVVITLLAYVTGWLAEADIWLRLTAARNDRHARIGLAVTAAASLLFVVALPAVLAARARAVFPDPAALTQPVLGALLAAIMPASARIVLLGGLAAVALSTVSTTANVVAITVARDGVPAFAARSLPFARWASAAAVLLALAVAYASRSLAELFYLSAGLLAAGLFWPTVALLWRQPPVAAARLAAFIGLPAVVLSFAAERAGMLTALLPAAVQEMGIGYIVPGVAAGGLAFGLALLVARPAPSQP
jgi:solute:Na+ symporter, SSS family